MQRRFLIPPPNDPSKTLYIEWTPIPTLGHCVILSGYLSYSRGKQEKKKTIQSMKGTYVKSMPDTSGWEYKNERESRKRERINDKLRSRFDQLQPLSSKDTFAWFLCNGLLEDILDGALPRHARAIGSELYIV